MHSKFIAAIAVSIGASSYLELGLYTGDTFLAMESIVNRAVGVDKSKMFSPLRGEVLTCTTDEYFLNNSEMFDMVFIDADHCFDSARRDLINSLERLNKYGVIVMHDTDPSKEELLDNRYCGDSYRVVDWIIESREDLNVVTLPVSEPGLSIIQRKSDRRVNSII